MSFDRSFLNPTLDTHEPVKVHIPPENNELISGRPDLPTPSLWQKSVKVVHKLSGIEAVVVTVDYATMMFRAYYPDQGDIDEETGKPKGRFADRTEWEHCREWNVAVTYTPRELERQKARAALDAEIARLDPRELAAVAVLCDDPDPAKALGKLEALRALGVVRVSSAAAQEAVAAVREPAEKPDRRRKAPPSDGES